MTTRLQITADTDFADSISVRPVEDADREIAVRTVDIHLRPDNLNIADMEVVLDKIDVQAVAGVITTEFLGEKYILINLDFGLASKGKLDDRTQRVVDRATEHLGGLDESIEADIRDAIDELTKVVIHSQAAANHVAKGALECSDIVKDAIGEELAFRGIEIGRLRSVGAVRNLAAEYRDASFKAIARGATVVEQRNLNRLYLTQRLIETVKVQELTRLVRALAGLCCSDEIMSTDESRERCERVVTEANARISERCPKMARRAEDSVTGFEHYDVLDQSKDVHDPQVSQREREHDNAARESSGK